MKKIITMLMGVVMASSMFIATAHADETPYCSISADKAGEINIGDEVVFSVSLDERNVTAEVVGIKFDTNLWECVKVTNSAGKRTWKLPAYNYGVNPEEEDVETELSYSGSSVTAANTSGKATLSFLDTGSVSYVADAVDNALKVTLKAKEVVADTEATVTLYQELDGPAITEFGTDTVYPETAYIGDAEVLTYTIKAPVVDEKDYGTAGNEFEGKATKYWTVDFAEWTGAADVSLTDGTTTKTINVTTADDSEYDIAGAVSFYVYVIGNDIANVYIVE